MHKINEVTIFTQQKEITYVVGGKIFKNNDGVEIYITKITFFLNNVKVFLSNGEIIIFKNATFTYIKNGR